VGGESPIKLMRLPGEPARPPPLAHSFVILGAETDALDIASSMGDAAGRTLSGASDGLISGVPSEGGVNLPGSSRSLGRLVVLLLSLLLPHASGLALILVADELHVGMTKVSSGRRERRLSRGGWAWPSSKGQTGKGPWQTHENFPAACFVTAAAMPLLSFACFFSVWTYEGQSVGVRVVK
jgi:hypothetical protein